MNFTTFVNALNPVEMHELSVAMFKRRVAENQDLDKVLLKPTVEEIRLAMGLGLVHGVKAYRDRTGQGLGESKFAIEQAVEQYSKFQPGEASGSSVPPLHQ